VPLFRLRHQGPRARHRRLPRNPDRSRSASQHPSHRLRHSCAQHYIGDIGLLGAKVAVDAEGEETVEGYHVHVGGGFAADPAIGRELCRDIKAEDLPPLIERMLRAYLARRLNERETFRAFTARHSTDELKTMFDAGGM
jgi:ferredoxin-nitrite reductase